MVPPRKIPLIRKTSRTFLWVSLLLMAVSMIVLYVVVKRLLTDEVEEELYSTRARIESSLQMGHAPQVLPPVIEVTPAAAPQPERLKDTLIFDPSQNEEEQFRELSGTRTLNGRLYQITVRTLVVEADTIFGAVLLSYLLLLLAVFVFLFLFERSRNRRLWEPFFANLQAMKQFTLTQDQPVSLVESDILEFDELRQEVRQLTDKVRADYRNLKNYTEDVSHEMQTPLAIIQAKIEGMMNSEGLNPSHFEQLSSILRDIKRLAQTQRRLALLTKIENRQFTRVDNIDIAGMLSKQLQDFSEITDHPISFRHDGPCLLAMDPYLAEVLCNNLLSNAVRYAAKGVIEVELTAASLAVSNSGDGPLEHPEHLFSRFYREGNAPRSTGIGLAIVKRICDLYDFNCTYSYREGRHFFSVAFNTPGVQDT